MLYIYIERFLDHLSSLTKIRSIPGFIKLCKRTAQISGYYDVKMMLFTLI